MRKGALSWAFNRGNSETVHRRRKVHEWSCVQRRCTERTEEEVGRDQGKAKCLETAILG